MALGNLVFGGWGFERDVDRVAVGWWAFLWSCSSLCFLWAAAACLV